MSWPGCDREVRNHPPDDDDNKWTQKIVAAMEVDCQQGGRTLSSGEASMGLGQSHAPLNHLLQAGTLNRTTVEGNAASDLGDAVRACVVRRCAHLAVAPVFCIQLH